MTPRHIDAARVLADVANALQTVVLLVEHLDRTLAAAARDVTAIRVGLERATQVLRKGVRS